MSQTNSGLPVRPWILVSAAVALGVGYVLVHERRRKTKPKKPAKNEGDGLLIPREKLIRILDETSQAAYSLIEATRQMIHRKHEETGESIETLMDQYKVDFEDALKAVEGGVRMKHKITQEQLAQATQQQENDPEVQAAVEGIKEAHEGKRPNRPIMQEPVNGQKKRKAKKRTG